MTAFCCVVESCSTRAFHFSLQAYPDEQMLLEAILYDGQLAMIGTAVCHYSGVEQIRAVYLIMEKCAQQVLSDWQWQLCKDHLSSRLHRPNPHLQTWTRAP